MATITKGKTFINGETVTPAKIHQLVDAATVTNIVNADISNTAAIAATKLATISTAGKVSNSATTATAANTANAIVARNASGNFSAGSITADNSVFIGTTTALDPLTTNENGTYLPGTATAVFTRFALPCIQFIRRTNSSTGSILEFWRGNPSPNQVGSISVTSTATSYNTSSDYRLKQNATPLTGALAAIQALNPCQFTWKSDGSTGRGFIAHELQAIVPEAVTGEKDAINENGTPHYQGVDTSKLVPYLVAAVQELTARLAALEAAK
jgi:hypothetical protein